MEIRLHEDSATVGDMIALAAVLIDRMSEGANHGAMCAAFEALYAKIVNPDDLVNEYRKLIKKLATMRRSDTHAYVRVFHKDDMRNGYGRLHAGMASAAEQRYLSWLQVEGDILDASSYVCLVTILTEAGDFEGYNELKSLVSRKFVSELSPAVQRNLGMIAEQD